MIGYVAVIILLTILVIFRSIWFTSTCLRASKNIQKDILTSVLRAPVNLYYDIVPNGRTLNHFSKDLDSIDSLLPDFLLQNVQNLFHVLGILFTCILSAPFFIIIMIPIGQYILPIPQYVVSVLNTIFSKI